MKTIELSEAKARTLVEYLALKWADLAIRIAASNATVNTPFRFAGEGMKTPAFVARVKRRRAELAAVAEVLTSLGATLPVVDRTAIVGPYTSALNPRKKYEQWYGSTRAATELRRLVEAIRASVGGLER